MDASVPFLVRRARLLLGMTQAEFAQLFGVDDGTVSRWERGKLHPAPKILQRIRNILLKESSALDAHLVRISPVYKCLVNMKDLTKLVVFSKGMIEAIKAFGTFELDDDKPFDIAELSRKSSYYEVSSGRALEIIQGDPRWSRGEIAYGEMHYVSSSLGGVWTDAIIAPLLDRDAAIIEFAPSKRGAAEGFWVELISLQDIPLDRFSSPAKAGKES
jgi:transcriptional regulator with XRE-family HTH domain